MPARTGAETGTQPVVHVVCRVGEAGKWVLGRKVFWDRLRLSKEEVRCFLDGDPLCGGHYVNGALAQSHS